MSAAKKSGLSKWIPYLVMGILTFVTAVLGVAVKYYEIQKARAEAEKAQAEARPHQSDPKADSTPEQPKPPSSTSPTPRPPSAIETPARVEPWKPEPRVTSIQADPPFDKYLLANPILLEVPGFKLIRLKGGGKVILSVASTEMKDDSASERVRAERVCRLKATVGSLKEKQGILIAHAETLDDGKVTVAISTENASSSDGLETLKQMTSAKVEGIVKEMPPVGRWRSPDGKIFFLATGVILDANGDPLAMPDLP